MTSIESASHPNSSRRDFLRNSLALAVGTAATPLFAGCSTNKAAAPKLGSVVGTGRFKTPEKTTTILVTANLDDHETPVSLFHLGFFGHGFVENPLDSQRAVVFEKRGPGACEVNMTSGEVLRTIKTATNHQFYGHGAFTPDGATMFCTESIVSKNYQGILAVRDGKSFQGIGQIDTHGLRPHDCTLIDDGKVMVVTNAGGPIDSKDRPSVTYVELASNKLLDKVEFSTELIGAGHLEIAANGDLLCVSAPRNGLKDEIEQPGGFSIRRVGAGSRFTTMTEPVDVTKKMTAETLSVAIHEPTRTAAATNPHGNLITFWDLDKEVYRGKLEVEHPRGVCMTRDGDQFVFSHGATGKPMNLFRVDPTTLQRVPGSQKENVGITGSHLFLYEPPTA